jgi:hypothetical protein
MINNNYALSLRICLKIQSIDHISIFCPLYKTKITNKLKNFNNLLKQTFPYHIGISSKKIDMSEADLHTISERTKGFLDEVEIEVAKEKRVNVTASLEVLREELKSLIALL